MTTATGGLYLSPFTSQYAPTASWVTRASGCTWTSAANGARLSSGGKVNLTPDQVHELVDRTEETDPRTPGWSIPDVDRAMARAKVPFDNRTGTGRTGVRAAWAAGCAVLLQGDSDQFPNTTCSGAFNDAHAILIHPARRRNSITGRYQRLIGDPICGDWRWEDEAVIWKYGEKLNAGLRFGVFTTPVPKTTTTAPALRYNVAIAAPTVLYAKPGGARVKTVNAADYRCGRSYIAGRWWFHIISRTDFTLAANRGLWFLPNAHTTVRPA